MSHDLFESGQSTFAFETISAFSLSRGDEATIHPTVLADDYKKGLHLLNRYSIFYWHHDLGKSKHFIFVNSSFFPPALNLVQHQRRVAILVIGVLIPKRPEDAKTSKIRIWGGYHTYPAIYKPTVTFVLKSAIFKHRYIILFCNVLCALVRSV